MQLSSKAQDIYSQIDKNEPKRGDVKKLAAKTKKNHALAMELWSTGEFGPRLLAILIMDKLVLTQDAIDTLAAAMAGHEDKERDNLSEWLLAHQLTKSKRTLALIETWENNPSSVLRRLFWYHQARLRWTGQTPPENTADLLASLKTNMATELPDVQWAMNFSAGQIGIHEPKYRAECINLGKKLGLYKGDPVSRGCTPNYLPEFIEIEVAKLKKRR